MIIKYVIRYFALLVFILLNQGCYLNTSIVQIKDSSASQDVPQPIAEVPGATPTPEVISKYNSIAALSSAAKPIAKAEFGNYILFEAGDNINGRELWKLNKINGAVSLVKDICPGAGSASIFFLQQFNGDYYFFADDCVHGMELWKTDGTELGTKLVKDIEPGAVGSYDSSYYLYIDTDRRGIAFAGRYFFGAKTTAHGIELWSTDGTEVGTELTSDIFTGTGSSDPREYVILNSKIYFIAEDSSSGAELWSSDGTSAGTSLVKDIYPGIMDSFAMNLMILGSKIIFTANDGSNGQELFISDGTGAGTVILKNIRSGSASSSPQSFVKLGSKIIFTARESTSYQPWVTDGTALGTVKLTAQVQLVILPNLFKEFNGKIYFIATTTTSGLYETDGTPGGTVLVKDQITTGTGPFVGEVVNNKLVFPCIVAAGDELCVTDGTTSGTSVLTDLISGASALYSSWNISIPE